MCLFVFICILSLSDILDSVALESLRFLYYIVNAEVRIRLMLYVSIFLAFTDVLHSIEIHFYAFATRQCQRRHYVSRLSVRSSSPICYHDIS